MPKIIAIGANLLKLPCVENTFDLFFWTHCITIRIHEFVPSTFAKSPAYRLVHGTGNILLSVFWAHNDNNVTALDGYNCECLYCDINLTNSLSRRRR